MKLADNIISKNNPIKCSEFVNTVYPKSDTKLNLVTHDINLLKTNIKSNCIKFYSGNPDSLSIKYNKRYSNFSESFNNKISSYKEKNRNDVVKPSSFILAQKAQDIKMAEISINPLINEGSINNNINIADYNKPQNEKTIFNNNYENFKNPSINKKDSLDNLRLFNMIENDIEHTTRKLREQLTKSSSIFRDCFNFYLCPRSLNGFILNSIQKNIYKFYSLEKLQDTIEELALLKIKCINDEKEYDYWINENLLYKLATNNDFYNDSPNFKSYLKLVN